MSAPAIVHQKYDLRLVVGAHKILYRSRAYWVIACCQAESNLVARYHVEEVSPLTRHAPTPGIVAQIVLGAAKVLRLPGGWRFNIYSTFACDPDFEHSLSTSNEHFARSDFLGPELRPALRTIRNLCGLVESRLRSRSVGAISCVSEPIETVLEAVGTAVYWHHIAVRDPENSPLRRFVGSDYFANALLHEQSSEIGEPAS